MLATMTFEKIPSLRSGQAPRRGFAAPRDDRGRITGRAP